MLHTTRIVLTDAHPVVRAGLKAIFRSQPDMEVVAEAGTLDETIALATDMKPDIVVIDPVGPELNGRDPIAELKRAWPECKVVVFTRRVEPGPSKRAIDAGASAYFFKTSPLEEVLRAIRTAMAGGICVDPTAAGAILGWNSANGMTMRASRVLEMIARGFSNKETAAALGISVKTCEADRKAGMHRAGIRTRVELVRFAATLGWLD